MSRFIYYRVTMTNELDLISQAQAGDSAAFGKLYDAYIKKIYDFVYYKTMHKETAEDLTSQSFLKAYKRLNTFKGDKGTFQAWMYQIARNTVIDHYRAQRPTTDIEDAWGLADKTDIAMDAVNKDLIEQVKQELNNFTAEQREIIILRVWQGLSYAEIAAITGKSENNCKVIFSRTLNKLRQSPNFAAVLLFFITSV